MFIFLFDTVALAADEAVGFTMTDIWNHSGALARTVIGTLGAMLVAAVVVSIERLLALGRARSRSIALAGAVGKHMQSDDIGAALKVAQDESFKAAYLGALLRAGLTELAERDDKHGIENAQRAVDKAIAEEVSKSRRGMAILATVGSTAPFVGLFGTTFGVINAFQGMATAGSGLAAISAGISEALITTGVGIFVAVIGVWAFNYFNGRIEKITEELSSSEHEFFAWAYKRQQPAAGE